MSGLRRREVRAKEGKEAVTWTLEKEFTFDAAHRLPHVPAGHQCGIMHGHTYRLIVRVEAKRLGSGHLRGMVIEYGDLSEIVLPFVKRSSRKDGTPCVDHCTLNDVPGLENPTTEVLAEWFYTELESRIPRLSSVVVCESSSTRVEYKP
jgi:6-pyruvoyltetrahydropterin/6-carboxytetrahydropterin synthase